jgi:hypothetical protein
LFIKYEVARPMKHRATVPNTYAHDESLGMSDSLPRPIDALGSDRDPANFYSPLKFAVRFPTNDFAVSRIYRGERQVLFASRLRWDKKA